MTLDKQTIRHYRRFRAAGMGVIVGHDAESSLSLARTLTRWEELEAAGLVRLELEGDDSYTQHDFDGAEKCRNHPKNNNEHATECAECRALDRGDGPFVLLGQYRTDEDGEWEMADCIGGLVGYRDAASPFENCYAGDIMAATIEAYDLAAADAAAMKLAAFGDVPAAMVEAE